MFGHSLDVPSIGHDSPRPLKAGDEPARENCSSGMENQQHSSHFEDSKEREEILFKNAEETLHRASVSSAFLSWLVNKYRHTSLFNDFTQSLPILLDILFQGKEKYIAGREDTQLHCNNLEIAKNSRHRMSN